MWLPVPSGTLVPEKRSLRGCYVQTGGHLGHQHECKEWKIHRLFKKLQIKGRKRLQKCTANLKLTAPGAVTSQKKKQRGSSQRTSCSELHGPVNTKSVSCPACFKWERNPSAIHRKSVSKLRIPISLPTSTTRATGHEASVHIASWLNLSPPAQQGLYRDVKSHGIIMIFFK